MERICEVCKANIQLDGTIRKSCSSPDLENNQSRNKIDIENRPIIDVLRKVEDYFPVVNKFHPSLIKCLKRLSCTQLLQLAVEKQEILDYGESLFRKLCTRENIKKIANDSTYAECYCRHYLKKVEKEQRKKEDWELNLLTMIAIRKVRRRNEIRKLTMLRTKELNVPHSLCHSSPLGKRAHKSSMTVAQSVPQKRTVTNSQSKKKPSYAPLYLKSRNDCLKYLKPTLW